MAYKEIRTISYPVIMAGKAFDRVGVFDVKFSASGRPLEATMLRFVGYESSAELIEFWESVEAAIVELPTLHIQESINLDNEPAWDGTLRFPDPHTRL